MTGVLKNLFNTVFDEQGNVKVCGRESCKKLILELQKLYPDLDFGNPETGVMNVAAIKSVVGGAI